MRGVCGGNVEGDGLRTLSEGEKAAQAKVEGVRKEEVRVSGFKQWLLWLVL